MTPPRKVVVLAERNQRPLITLDEIIADFYAGAIWQPQDSPQPNP